MHLSLIEISSSVKPLRGEAWFPNSSNDFLTMQRSKMSVITGKTSLVALLGDPVSHSLSPVMHNAAFMEMNLDWRYLAIPCETENLEIVIKALRHTNCKGLNITIPHKQNALKCCKEVSLLAKELGVINTLIPSSTGNWKGTNTDVEGFINPIKNQEWRKKNAVIIGSGGSARAVLFGLKNLKFKSIMIISRNKITMNELINKSQSECYSLNNREPNIDVEGIGIDDNSVPEVIQNADLIVNTTPIGMKINKQNIKPIDSIPLGLNLWSQIKPKAIFYDLIYTPRPTQWLQIGRQKGCKTIDGLEMLIQQGAASLQEWSGYEDIPIETMRDAIKNHLES